MTKNSPKSNINSIWTVLKTGLLIFDLENNFVDINDSAKDLLEYTSADNIGPYSESIIDLLNTNSDGYHKQITGIIGKPLNGTLHIYEDYKIVEVSESHETRLGEASHELRRPLSNIKTLVDTLYLWGAGDDPEARPKFLKQLHEQVDRLANTLNELLNLSRMQAGSIDISRQQIALSVLVNETIDLLKEQAAEKNITLKSEISDDYVLIADLDKITHVVQNLTENAIRYNKDGGTVTISPGTESNSFQVSDTGMGISPENQEKVFERFKRINKEIPGTGLGLAIVKTIVDLHGGQIDLESVEGEGTTFIVNLPKTDIVKAPV